LREIDISLKITTMKKPITIALSLIPLIGMAQIPVTDVASGGILTSINIQTIAGNKLTGKMLTQQQQIIANQKTLIELMREQNRTVKHTDKLKSEEIEAYKKAPENIIVDYQLQDLENVKKEIVEAAKGFVKFIRKAENLKTSDYKVYEDKTVEIVENTVMAWKQTKSLLSSNDKIIPARERQELLQNTIESIRKYVTKIKSFQNELSYINKKRNANDRMFGNKINKY